MLSDDQIVALYKDRVANRSGLLERMRAFRRIYQGELVLPLPEIGKNESAVVANLIQSGCDQYARRLMSIPPNTYFPPLSQATRASRQKAETRHDIMTGWHHDAGVQPVIMGKGGRHYFGYGVTCFQVTPGDEKRNRPLWRLRDPLEAFPAEMDDGEVVPDDIIHHFTRTLAWLRKHYPAQAAVVAPDPNTKPDTTYSLLEYQSADQHALVLVGNRDMTRYGGQVASSVHQLMLENYENYCGQAYSIVIGRATIDKLMGHFDQVIGTYITEAEIVAMQVIGMKRAIWPRTWVVSNTNETPRILRYPKPNEGKPGMIAGGVFEREQVDPSYASTDLANRLQAAEREGAGLPAEWSGLSQSQVRTGRRGSQIMAATTDFTLAEAQIGFEKAIWEADRLAIKIDKTHHSGRKTFVVNTRSVNGEITYDPLDIWETEAHVVEIAKGLDAQDRVVVDGQKVAMGTKSRLSAMEQDPDTHDARAEKRRIDVEAFEDAFKAKVQTMAADPNSPMTAADFASLARKIASGEEWYDAIEKVQEEAQERQASIAPPAPPGMGAAPQTMPGMELPGMGAEMMPSVPEMPSGMDNINSIMSVLQNGEQMMNA